MVLESKTHNIKKEARERERETCELCFVEFVSPRVNLNHISYFFEIWCHLANLNHISNAFVKGIKKFGVYRLILFIFYFY